jgi:hypothetical protein
VYARDGQRDTIRCAVHSQSNVVIVYADRIDRVSVKLSRSRVPTLSPSTAIAAELEAELSP